MQTLTYKVNFAPEGIPTTVRLSQNENGRSLQFAFIGDRITIPDGSVVTISGTKPDGHVYSAEGTLDGDVATFDEEIQMTAAAGEWAAKLKVTHNGLTVATQRLWMIIDADTALPGSVPSESELNGLVAEAQQYAENARSAAYGSPLTATLAADMLDTSRVYVYTGSETGMIFGHWYYYEDGEWEDGGVYQSQGVQTDTTLSITGMPADAGAAGTALDGKVNAEAGKGLSSNDFTTAEKTKLAGIADQATRVLVDSTLKVSGMAADSKVVGDEIDGLKEDLSKINDKKYLFIGDSYAEGYSHDGNNSGWCRYLVGYLGLAQDKYEIRYNGGSGFVNGGFATLLDNATGTDFTDIVVCGGYNDNTSSESAILSAIESFKESANTKYPSANVNVGFIAKNKHGNGTGAIAEWETKRDALSNVVLPAYQKCSAFGCRYLTNVECWLTDSGLTPSDGYHPSAEGNQAIAKAIANALATGAAPFPNDKYFTDEIKTALLKCFEKIVWPVGGGRDLYLELAKALRVKTSNRREELPVEYEQVEYIRSTREQYIALNDILSAIPFNVSTKASIETNGTNTGGYLLSSLGTSTQRFYAVTYTNQKIAARIGNNNWLELGTIPDAVVGEVYQIETDIVYASGGDATLSMKYDKAQESTTLSAQSVSGVDGHALALFASNTTGSIKGSWTLYDIVIRSGQTKLFDGIPCYRKSDGKTGLYNAVNGTFYPNATNTEFVTGDVIE